MFTGEYPRGKNQARALKIGHFFHGDRFPGINRDCPHQQFGFLLGGNFQKPHVKIYKKGGFVSWYISTFFLPGFKFIHLQNLQLGG